jgi:hypothetical protein
MSLFPFLSLLIKSLDIPCLNGIFSISIKWNGSFSTREGSFFVELVPELDSATLYSVIAVVERGLID